MQNGSIATTDGHLVDELRWKQIGVKSNDVRGVDVQLVEDVHGLFEFTIAELKVEKKRKIENFDIASREYWGYNARRCLHLIRPDIHHCHIEDEKIWVQPRTISLPG